MSDDPRRDSEAPPHVRAHLASSNHDAALRSSTRCGCFYCLKIFAPAAIEEWCDGRRTALCPRCGIDSVIGDASGYPVTVEFLRAMHDYWF